MSVHEPVYQRTLANSKWEVSMAVKLLEGYLGAIQMRIVYREVLLTQVKGKHQQKHKLMQKQ